MTIIRRIDATHPSTGATYVCELFNDGDVCVSGAVGEEVGIEAVCLPAVIAALQELSVADPQQSKAEVARQTERVRVLRDENDRLRVALQLIASEDFLGNRPHSVFIAEAALAAGDEQSS